MRSLFRSVWFCLAILVFASTLTACGGSAPPATLTPDTPVPNPFAEIDNTLAQSVESSIAYNAPQTMVLDQPTTIELVMNPSVTPTMLATEVSHPGPVVSASIDITPLMKADLIPLDPTAFTIQPLQDNPVQVISGRQTTRWQWAVTPQKSGSQGLTLLISRQVMYQGDAHWRDVKSYEANIDVQVTLQQRLASLPWGWIGGLVASAVTALLFPALKRWFDTRTGKKSPEAQAGGNEQKEA